MRVNKSDHSSALDGAQQLCVSHNVRRAPLCVSKDFSCTHLISTHACVHTQLLEEDSTRKRLEREKEILSETVKYTSAAAALKSALGGTGGGSSSEGSSGGGSA
jgi:hypothetical protein